MNKEIDELIKLLLKVNGFEEFLNTFDNSNGLELLCDEFYEYKKKNGGINTTLKETFDQIIRYKHLILEKYGTNALYYINPDKIIDDSELDEFRKDWESSRTTSVASKLRDIQRYKTYTEYFLYYKYEADWLLPKYSDATHPLINATLCRSLILSGQYQKALSFMANGLNYSLRYPHLYWHSKFGMIGCSMILWDLAWLISHRKDFNLSHKEVNYWEQLQMKVFKLLYLSLTRSIDMAPDLAQTCDFLSNRAELFYYNFDYFRIIFLDAGFVVSKEVQYIADKKMSFERACKFDSLGGLFLEKQNESKMMYEYGCLHPMYDSYVVSPKYIEDDVTWDELKLRGLYRADAVSVSIYNDFRKHKLGFCRNEIEEIILELRKIYYDVGPRNEFAKIMNILEEAMQTKEYVTISDLIIALRSHKSSVSSFSCYKPIMKKLLSISQNVTYANSYVLKQIEDSYNKIERNYDWKDNED